MTVARMSEPIFDLNLVPLNCEYSSGSGNFWRRRFRSMSFCCFAVSLIICTPRVLGANFLALLRKATFYNEHRLRFVHLSTFALQKETNDSETLAFGLIKTNSLCTCDCLYFLCSFHDM